MNTKLLIIIFVSRKDSRKKGQTNYIKGSLYYHFSIGKEELLIACLKSLDEVITKDIKEIFDRYPNTQEATKAMIEKLIVNLETEGTITGYTFTSIVSEMASLSDPVSH